MLEDIPTLLAVIDSGSIQGAARLLDIARPTVRRRLERLEAEVGVPLLARGAGGLTATVAGEIFAGRAREMMHELDGLGRAARAVGVSPHGVLRIGIPTGMPAVILAQMTGALTARWPGVRLELVAGTTHEDLVRQVDCRFSFELDRPPGDEVEVVELGSMREQLVASRAYLDRRGPIETLEALEGHRLYGWIAPDTGTPTHLPVSSGPPLKVDFAMATNDLRGLVELAVDGAGLAFLPFDAALARIPALAAEDLVAVLPDRVGRVRPRRLVVSKAVAKAPVVAAFLAETRAAAAALFDAAPR